MKRIHSNRPMILGTILRGLTGASPYNGKTQVFYDIMHNVWQASYGVSGTYEKEQIKA